MAKNEIVKSFKGFVVYEVKGEADLTKITEHENLDNLRYRIANENEMSSVGFLPVIEQEVNEEGELFREEELVTSVAGFDIVKIGESKKKVPGNEVNKIVKKLTNQAFEEAKEKGEEFKPTKELKEFFKETAIQQLLPKCFTDEFETYAFHDKETGLFYVAVNSQKKAENINSFLRYVLGSLPVVPVEVNGNLEDVFTSFVTDQLNSKTVLGNYIEMKDEEGSLSWKKESLYESEAKELLENTTKKVTKIGLEFDGTTSFVVDTDLVFSQVKFDSDVTADGHDFISTFLLMGNEIRGAVKSLLEEVSQ